MHAFLAILILLSGQDLTDFQTGEKDPTVKVVKVQPEKGKAKPGDIVKVAFTFKISSGWHIYPIQPLFGKATEFQFDGAEVAGKIEEPTPVRKKEPVVGEVDYHEGTITMTVPLKVAGPGRSEIRGTVKYQICAKLCMDGETALRIPLAVEGPAAAAVQSVPDKPKQPFVKVVAVRPDKSKVKVGETVQLALDLEIPAGYYIYPATAKSTGKPTTFQGTGVKRTDDIVEPKPKVHKTEGLDPY